MESREQHQRGEVFGYDELCQRCLGNLSLLQRVLSSFMTSFAKDLDQLTTEVAAANIDAVEKLAHRMKGGSGNAAAHRLQRLTGNVERAAARKDVQQLPAEIKELQDEWARFTTAAAVTGVNHATPAESGVHQSQSGDTTCE